LLPRLQELRARTGRPHWLIIDEAHHLLPATWESAPLSLPQALDQVLLVTVHPDEVAPGLLGAVNTLVAVGQNPRDTVGSYCKALGITPPAVPEVELGKGEVLFWQRDQKQAPFKVRVEPTKTERRRHRRKYAEGELPPERSFFFRGPQKKLNLRAQNLFLFLQLADGVDDDTWLHHLHAGEYSGWFHDVIKDEDLATEAAAVEERAELSPL